VNGVLMMQ